MKCFVFYINIDQCLNMSNFDMFFYKLKSEGNFHLSEVRFADKNGEVDLKESMNSLDKALHEIRNYIDKNYISTYRIVFGMRVDTIMHQKWTDTVLYRLLWIRNGLLNNRIFVDSREDVQKNISVVVLHDRDLTLKQAIVGSAYQTGDDLKCLLREFGIDSVSDIAEEDVLVGMRGYEKREEITRNFCEDFLEDIKIRQARFRELAEKTTEDSMELSRVLGRTTPKRGSIFPIVEFADNLVGGICVFQKELDKNSMPSRLIAFLSIVEYVTLDFDTTTEGMPDQYHDSLRIKSIRKWEETMRSTNLQYKYGVMVDQYEQTLNHAKADLKNNLTASKVGQHVEMMATEMKIEVSDDSALESEQTYRDGFKQTIEKFQRVNYGNQHAFEDWETTYANLKESISNMEMKLEIFASNLTGKYYDRIKSRKVAKKVERSDNDTLYMQEDVAKKEEDAGRQKQQILDVLNEPQMNPSLGFADQLNLDEALEGCNKKIRFYLKCYRMVHPKNFFILLVAAGGAVLIHHLLMQTNLLSSLSMLRGFTWYFLSAVVLLLLCFYAPAQYFRHKINLCLEKLQEDMNTYISGYFKKAENFEAYINRMNELDVVSSYLDRLADLRRRSEEYAMKCLWHKKQIEKHLVKISYFRNLANSIPYEDRTNPDRCRKDLDVKKDVVNNEVYWPQVKYRED